MQFKYVGFKKAKFEYPNEFMTVKSKDSLLILSSSDSLYCNNFHSNQNRIFPNVFKSKMSRQTIISYIQDSVLLFHFGLPDVSSNHNSILSLYDYRTNWSGYFKFTGLPVKHYDEANGFYYYKDRKNCSEMDAISWNYKIDWKDTSTWIPIRKLISPAEWAKYTGLDKLEFCKVYVNRKPSKPIPIELPTWHSIDNFNSFNVGGSDITNLWLNDTIIIYGFGNQSALYEFNVNSHKSKRLNSQYKLLPLEITTDTTAEFQLNQNKRTYYDAIIKNVGGDGFFRIAMSNSLKYTNRNSTDHFDRVYLFWHKSNGEIIEGILPEEYYIIASVQNDTIFTAKRGDPKTFKMGEFDMEKLLIKGHDKVELGSYIMELKGKK
jgi:hypothetical protein